MDQVRSAHSRAQVLPPSGARPGTGSCKRLLWLKRLGWFTLGWTFLVILVGAYTRLVDAGLGCPDWPGCYGFFTVPDEAHEIALAEQRFPDAPVEVEKGWPEMIHRYLASTLGLLIFSLTALAWKPVTMAGPKSSVRSLSSNPVPLRLRRHMLLLSCFVVLQGLFGMWTVTLKLWPQVVTAHLLGGFFTLSALFLMLLRVHYHQRPLSSFRVSNSLRLGVVFCGVLLVGQIFLGGWLSSNYAALACPDFPTCQGELWPPADFRAGFDIGQSVGPNYLGGLMLNEARVAIHMAHRVGALIVTIGLLCVLWLLWRRVPSGPLRLSVMVAACLLTIQVALGITNVVALLPLPVAVAHNGVAALLLLAVVNLSFLLAQRHHPRQPVKEAEYLSSVATASNAGAM